MDFKILEKFKPYNFNQYTSEEKENAVKELIANIIEEKGLKEVDVSFGNGFGYYNGNIIVQDFNAPESLNISSYTVLTGILHEMRHKEQDDKGELDKLVYQHFAYSLSPNEVDAHSYAIQTLIQFANFFDDNEFDIYILKLMNADFDKQMHSRNLIKKYGYTDKAPEEYARIHSEYVNNYVCKKNPYDEGISYILGEFPNYATEYKENGILIIRQGRLKICIKNGKAYIDSSAKMDEMSSNEFINNLKAIMQMGLEYMGDKAKINEIHFPPEMIQFGVTKEQYDMLMKTLNVKNGKISFEEFQNIEPQENFTIGTPFVGERYYKKFKSAQQELMAQVEEYEDLLLSQEFEMMEEGEEKLPGFIALCQYKPEYSEEKLRLLFAAQKQGLNTIMYENLTEEQIKEAMLAQLNGLSRNELLQVVQSKDEARKTRLLLQANRGIRSRVHKIELNEDCDILQEQVLDEGPEQ